MTDKRLTIPETGLTKDQETALMKTFYQALPQESYLKAILKGFPEYAEAQIENGYGLNPLTTINQQADAIGKANEDLVVLTRERDTATQTAKGWQESYQESEKQLRAIVDSKAADRETIAQLVTQAEANRVVIKELKAMLFDYMATYGKIGTL